ncbi:hypothetical protein Hypma_009323 [Hypsizygus marmoreus]|uniref:Uncharacterized protein n=1 Tax=Hypsizygus marmoreus TaxID=39966 RepID=A0A369JVS5_HYPMA|nr:hypothetical protein Hypma_009323 [Hypsizygus marmoreus]
MSLGEADGKFPTANEGTGLPPEPSVENPGQVFPKSSPVPAPITPPLVTAEQYIGNPFLIGGALRKVDHAIGEVIAILESEEASNDSADEDNPLLRKFRAWREELDDVRSDLKTPPVRSRASPAPQNSRSHTRSRSRPREGGGMFVD